MKIKKCKAALLVVATAALIGSLAYDKKCKKDAQKELEKEAESENNFIL